MAIALVHLDTVHEGLLVGRNIAPDAVQVRKAALYIHLARYFYFLIKKQATEENSGHTPW